MKAEYVRHMGDDLAVADAARVSFNKKSEWVQRRYEKDQEDTDFHELKVLDEEFPARYEEYEDYSLSHDDEGYELTGFELSRKDQKLITYLAKHDHYTPFTHPQITMREKVPIFVARQRFKHVVGFSYNEVSRRYVDDTPEFFTPDVWRGRPEGSIKQGSSDIEIQEMYNYIDQEILDRSDCGERIGVEDQYSYLIKICTGLYDKMVEAGVAPEQARMVLPQSMYTEYVVTGSLAAWARAYKLRIDGHAQKEIQDLAKQWNEILRPLFPVSCGALVD